MCEVVMNTALRTPLISQFIQDVLKHGERIKASTAEGNSNGKSATLTPNSVRRQSTLAIRTYQDKIGAYQHLLYHLQTQPKHLSTLVVDGFYYFFALLKFL